MLGGDGSSSSAALPEVTLPPKTKKEKVQKTASQEAWSILKAATVKMTEADGLGVKLARSGLLLAVFKVLFDSFYRQSSFLLI